jgi:hypothetical protein
MWHLSNEEHLTLSNEIRDDFAMGTYGHKLLEIYYTELRNSTLTKALEAINNYRLPEGYPLSHERREAVFNRVRDYWMKYSTVGDVLISTRPKKVLEMRNNGQDIFRSYVVEEPLVEKGFSFPLLDTPEALFVLEGKIDLIGWMSGMELFMDHKFQTRAHALYPKSIQFRNYALVTGFKTGIINYIRLHKNLEKDTLERKIISFAPGELSDWRVELIDRFFSIEREMSKGAFFKNRASCSGKYGFPCQYTSICDERELITINAIKEMKYKKKEAWTPW